MRAVNLLPANAYAPKQRLPHAPVVLAATAPVLAGAIVFLGYSMQHAKVVSKQSDLGLLQSQIAQLAPSPQLATQTAGIAAERQAREAALTDALVKRFPWDWTFEALARVVPPGAWLTSLSASSPTPAASAASQAVSPTSLSAQGYADSQQTVARLLARLALVPALSNVALTSTNSTTVGSHDVIGFAITAQLGGGS